MKNLKKWLPVTIIALLSLLCTSCKVDWSTVSAVETNIFAVVLFWILVHILIPAALFIGFCVLLDPESFDSSLEEGSEPARWILGFALIGIYVFHFFYMKAPWFNLSCLTQLGLLALAFIIFNMVLYDDTDAESIIYTIIAAGIVIVSLLANVFTEKYLEPFVFSCAGWLSIILGSAGRKLRDDGEIGAEILSPVLCLAAMIFGLVHASEANFLYMIAIQCSIATVFSLLLITKATGVSFAVVIVNYIWVFISSCLYNSEKFGKSFGISLIGWGAIFVVLLVIAGITQKKNNERAMYLAELNAQRAKEAAEKRAKEKAEAEAKARIKAKEEAEAEAKAKAEAEAKAKAEADEKAKQEAEAKARIKAKEEAEAEAKAKAEAEAKAKAEADEKAKQEAEAKAAKEKQLEATKAALTQMESDLEAKKAEVASLGMDAQSIVKKAKLNKEIKELEPQIETLKAEVERLSK